MTDAQVLAHAAQLRIAADTWLSRMIGRAVFRVDVGDAAALTPDDGARLTAHVAGNRPAMYYAKVDTGAVAAVRDLSHAGMHVVAVSVALDLDPFAAVTPAATPGIVVDGFSPDDAEAVLDIAGSCFRHSRYHVDPDVPRAIAHRIKREWIASYVRGQRGDHLLVARSGGRPVGFMAVMSVRQGDRRVRVIDLIGIDNAYQRRGIGSALVAAFVDGVGPSEGRRVITQASNIPSLGLYERFGFRVTRTGYVLHMHV